MGGAHRVTMLECFPDHSAPLGPPTSPLPPPQPQPEMVHSLPARPTPAHHFPVSKSKRIPYAKFPHICIHEAPEKLAASSEARALLRVAPPTCLVWSLHPPHQHHLRLSLFAWARSGEWGWVGALKLPYLLKLRASQDPPCLWSEESPRSAASHCQLSSLHDPGCGL